MIEEQRRMKEPRVGQKRRRHDCRVHTVVVDLVDLSSNHVHGLKLFGRASTVTSESRRSISEKSWLWRRKRRSVPR